MVRCSPVQAEQHGAPAARRADLHPVGDPVAVEGAEERLFPDALAFEEDRFPGDRGDGRRDQVPLRPEQRRTGGARGGREVAGHDPGEGTRSGRRR